MAVSPPFQSYRMHNADEDVPIDIANGFCAHKQLTIRHSQAANDIKINLVLALVLHKIHQLPAKMAIFQC